MVLFSIAAWLLRVSFRPMDAPGEIDRLVEFIGAISFTIAGVGLITERRIENIYRPIGLLICFGLVIFIWIYLRMHPW